MSTIQRFVHPLRTLDPDDSDESDLAAFREIVGDSRVVCLGESAHHVAEFVRLRDRLTRYLVRELGFTALVLESGLPEGLLVDEWVRGGPGALAEIAADGICYAFGRSVETQAQLGWMRDRNIGASHSVGFYGMDVPGWCRTPLPGIVACLRRLPAQASDSALLALAAQYDPGRPDRPDATGPVGMSPEFASGLESGTAELVERAAAAGDEIASRCAYGAQRVVEFLINGLYPGPGRNLRNEVMAENLRWILEREERIVVSAHNVHLQRTGSFDGTAPIGSLLGPTLGSDLVVVGTTRGAGPVPGLDLDAPPERRFAPPTGAGGSFVPPDDSLDGLLDTVDFPHHLLDLRQVPSGLLAGVGAMSGQHRVIELEPRQAFDAIVHIRTITPARWVGRDTDREKERDRNKEAAAVPGRGGGNQAPRRPKGSARPGG